MNKINVCAYNHFHLLNKLFTDSEALNKLFSDSEAVRPSACPPACPRAPPAPAPARLRHRCQSPHVNHVTAGAHPNTGSFPLHQSTVDGNRVAAKSPQIARRPKTERWGRPACDAQVGRRRAGRNHRANQYLAESFPGVLVSCRRSRLWAAT